MKCKVESEACATPLWIFTRVCSIRLRPPQKAKQKAKAKARSRAERSLDQYYGKMSNTTANSNGKQCHCCLNNISDDSDHVQNFPCGHKICFFCFVTSTIGPACQVKDCPQKYTALCQYFNRGNPPSSTTKMTNYDNGNTDEINFQEWKKRMEDECKARCEEAIRPITAHYNAIILRAQQQLDAARHRAQQQHDAARQQHDAMVRQLEAKNHNRDIVCTDSDRFCAPVFAYLVPKEIMSLRRVCKPWEEAAKMTTVSPNSYFKVDSATGYNAMSVMTRALPNLQQLSLWGLGRGHKYSEGEDPNESHPHRTANWTTHDIEIISKFSKLRYLSIYNALLNGRYPVFFHSFPLLQRLSIHDCKFLKWDLEMLAGSPSLKELYCRGNENLTGNISSLRVLKDTLEKVTISDCDNVEGNIMDLADFPYLKKLYLYRTCVTGNIRSLRLLKGTLERVNIRYCPNVEGDFMDLANFPHLKILDLDGTAVTGDIWDIRENCFPSLECLYLPKGVYGGVGYEFQSIDDGPDVARALYQLKKQCPALKMEYWYTALSSDSPDWYESFDHYYRPPFTIRLAEAGSRIGYQWGAHQLLGRALSCEVNWLDPEPSINSSDYEKYIEELQKIEEERQEEGRVDLYRGIHQPPTEDEFHSLLEKYDLLPPTPREEELV
jgi:hypothetical protein